MKNVSIAALAALSLAACGEANHAPDATRSEEAPVNVLVVTADSVTATVTVDGTIQARERAEISTRMMARVTEVPVDLGTVVRAGQVLIRLGVEDVEANRARAQAGTELAVAARDEAARHAARMDTLLAQDAVSKVQRDQAHLGLAHADAQVTVAEAALREVQVASGYAALVAPFDGVVVSRTVNLGDLAAPGMPLLAVEASGPRDAVIAVAPEVSRSLLVGTRVELVGRDGRRIEAPVRTVAGGADAASRTVEVRIGVSADWLTGTSVTLLLPTGRRTALLIPSTAVVRRGQLTGVYVVQNGVRVLRWVRLGRSINDRVEVLSGLEAGEQIAS